jgi:hypothetical protein
VKRALACLAVVSLACAGAVNAQGSRRVDPAPADRALSQGRLDDAERELYAASRRAPREPSTRGALGELLAARGHLRIGAVLLEEARQFGGDAATINARLAHLYRWLDDWTAAATLPPAASFDAAERMRARWLASHTPLVRAVDSVIVALTPNEIAGFGQIVIRVGTVEVRADIDPNVEGIVLPATAELLGGLQLFGERDGVTLAVAPSVAIGGWQRTNVPVSLERNGTARIGFDLLAPFTPTFNAGARTLTLHAANNLSLTGREVPILLGFPGVRIVTRVGEAPVPMESAAGRAALRGGAWTFSLRRGAIVAPE